MDKSINREDMESSDDGRMVSKRTPSRRSEASTKSPKTSPAHKRLKRCNVKDLSVERSPDVKKIVQDDNVLSDENSPSKRRTPRKQTLIEREDYSLLNTSQGSAITEIEKSIVEDPEKLIVAESTFDDSPSKSDFVTDNDSEAEVNDSISSSIGQRSVKRKSRRGPLVCSRARGRYGLQKPKKRYPFLLIQLC